MAIKPVSGEIKAQPLNDNFSYLESLVRTGGGLQMETFNDIDDLKMTYPNGEDGAFILKNTGEWAYWSVNQWLIGGKFIESEFTGVLTDDGEEWVI